MLELVPLRRVGVLDTDATMNDLARRVHPGAASPVLPLPLLVSTRWIAARHVFDEFYAADEWGHASKFDKLEKQAADLGLSIPAERFRHVFETEYLPRIRFVEIGEVLADHELPSAVTHDKDVPTAQLAALVALADCIVFSHDKHLRRPGIAPMSLEPVISATKPILASESINASVAMTVMLGGISLDEVAQAAARRLGIPRIAVWSTAVVLAIVYLRDSERRAKARPIIHAVGTAIVQTSHEAAKARRTLTAAALKVAAEPPLECRIARILVLSHSAHSVREIRARLSATMSSPPSETTLRRLLRTAPCFVETARGRWELGDQLSRPSQHSD